MKLDSAFSGLGPARKKLAALSRLQPHFAPLVRKERARLSLAVLAGTLGSAMVLARPWPLKIVFDNVLAGRPYEGWLQGLGALDTGAVVALVCGLFLLVVLLEGVFTYWQQVLTAKAGQRVVFGLRKRLFSHLVRLSLGFHRGRRSGDLLLRLTGDIQLLRDMLVGALVLLTSQGAVVVGMLVVSVWLDPVLAAVSLAVVPLLGVASLKISKGIRVAARKQRRKESEMAATASETLGAIALVKAYGRERRHAEAFASHNSASLKQGLRTTRLEALLGRIAEVTTATGVCAVLGVGTLRASQGLITPGELIVFLSYVTAVYRPVRRIARFAARLSKAFVCAERVVDVLDTKARVVDRKDAVEAPRFEGRIALKQVSYTYPGKQRPALDRVSLTLEPGELVALAGPVGSGKSTLAGLVLRLFNPDAGRLRIDGEDIRSYQLESLRARIAVVPQEPLLFRGTILDNVAYGLDSVALEDVRAAARSVGADGFIEELPQSWETIVGEKGVTLSSGQRQLLALARALVKDASIVILDEPTANLDAVARGAVRRALGVLLEGRTALLITHTLNEALEADRVVVLRKGRIVETGTPAELRQAGGWFESALASHVQLSVADGSC